MKMTKSERLELRCTREQRRIIGQAVELHGGSLSDFIISAAQERAMQLIRQYQLLRLGRQDSLRLADALLNVPEPTSRHTKAARRYSSEN